MKKFGFFLFAVLGLIACGDDNNDPTPEQHVTCSISAPAEGAMVNIAEKMTIKGEATIDSGEISNVTLKVGGKAISEVTAVPFSYDYTFEGSSSNLVVISFLFRWFSSSSFLILQKVVDMFAF